MPIDVDNLGKTHRPRHAQRFPGKAWDTSGEHPSRQDENAFLNPSPDHPVPTTTLLDHLDLSVLRPALLAAYTDPEALTYDPTMLVTADAFKALRQTSPAGPN